MPVKGPRQRANGPRVLIVSRAFQLHWIFSGSAEFQYSSRKNARYWLTIVATAASTAPNSQAVNNKKFSRHLKKHETITTLEGSDASFCARRPAWQTRVISTAGAAMPRTSMYVAASGTTRSGAPVAFMIDTENVLKSSVSMSPSPNPIPMAIDSDSPASLCLPSFRSPTMTLVVPTAKELKIHCAELKTSVFGPRAARSSVEENYTVAAHQAGHRSGFVQAMLWCSSCGELAG
mmetsp:Transcript_36744/g.103679  ORF Transcript_36744/g.103679 Transcript_36744/m.103679 type:complete len:234 (+) Transcript_36744:1479-2180(+)